MTTIAWDGKTIAADRCRTNGNTKEISSKLFVCGDYVYGSSGCMAEAEAIIRWLSEGAAWERRPAFDEPSSHGLVIRRADAALFIVTGKTATLVSLPAGPTASGSGMDFALAAMACGKDARGAVAIASIFDAGTGYGCDAIDITTEGT